MGCCEFVMGGQREERSTERISTLHLEELEPKIVHQSGSSRRRSPENSGVHNWFENPRSLEGNSNTSRSCGRQFGSPSPGPLLLTDGAE